MNLSASELREPVSLQTPPEIATIPTVLAEDNNAGIITHGILQVLEEEDVDRVETIAHKSDNLRKQAPDPDPTHTVESDATRFQRNDPVDFLGTAAALTTAARSRTSEFLEFPRGGSPTFLSGQLCHLNFEKDWRQEIESALSERTTL